MTRATRANDMKSLASICLITRDLPRLRFFYEIVLRVSPEGNDTFTSFALPGAALTLFGEADLERMAAGSTLGIGRGACALEIEAEDVDAEHYRLLSLDVAIVKPPTTQPWGSRSVWFRDPDGNLINFFARVGA